MLEAKTIPKSHNLVLFLRVLGTYIYSLQHVPLLNDDLEYKTSHLKILNIRNIAQKEFAFNKNLLTLM